MSDKAIFSDWESKRLSSVRDGAILADIMMRLHDEYDWYGKPPESDLKRIALDMLRRIIREYDETFPSTRAPDT